MDSKEHRESAGPHQHREPQEQGSRQSMQAVMQQMFIGTLRCNPRSSRTSESKL